MRAVKLTIDPRVLETEAYPRGAILVKCCLLLLSPLLLEAEDYNSCQDPGLLVVKAQSNNFQAENRELLASKAGAISP